MNFEYPQNTFKVFKYYNIYYRNTLGDSLNKNIKN